MAALDRELSLADVWDVTDNEKDDIYTGDVAHICGLDVVVS